MIPMTPVTKTKLQHVQNRITRCNNCGQVKLVSEMRNSRVCLCCFERISQDYSVREDRMLREKERLLDRV